MPLHDRDVHEDRTWCREMLPRVSRTFALGILSLPDPFGDWITAGYLLCRVADTVEDADDVPWATRQVMFGQFIEALDGGDVGPFMGQVHLLPPGDDTDLSANLPAVLSLMASFPPKVQDILRRWVGEMGLGMAAYARRVQTGETELTALRDRADLVRYCYYVAGTVGHLLTDLFAAGSASVAAKLQELRPNAEAFGLLLQLTNIVKDVTDDRTRGWSFIPRSVCDAHGFPVEDLLDPANRPHALAAIRDVVSLARDQIQASVAFVLALPADEPALRRFCILPMMLAIRTLDLAEDNPAVLVPGQAVKISRDVVFEVIEKVETLLGDDEGIAALAMA